MTTAVVLETPLRGLSLAEPSVYAPVDFRETKAVWFEDDSLDSVDLSRSLTHLDNREVPVSTLSYNLMMSPECIQQIPFRGTRFFGGESRSIAVRRVTHEVTERRSGPSLGTVLALHHGALELLLLLARGSAHKRDIPVLIDLSSDTLEVVLTKLRQFRLVSESRNKVSLSAEGQEAVDRLRESANRLRKSYG
jgi:hypothetical protein